MRRLRIFLAVLALSLPLALPASAQTTSTSPPPCECFCKSENGAVDKGQLVPAACNSTCAAAPFTGTAVCAKDATFYPQSNPFCYATQDECVKTDAQGRDTATWDTNFKPPECMPGAHYCYPKRYADISLGFALGNVTKVSDLGNYIQVAYNVLLGIGTTIAIVMLMIGGFQYVIGAGAPEQLAKGKARMKNAVIGLVLLMSAYVILFTVNPQLVRLEVPQLRMSKGIQFIRPETSCEFLIEKGYSIDRQQVSENKNGEKFLCGSVAPVVMGTNNIAVPTGTTCQFSSCSEAGPDTKCAGVGKAAVCVACVDVVPGNDAGLLPSSGICNQLKKPDVVNGEGDPELINACFFTTDNDAMVGIGGTGGTALISGGTCAELAVDCVAARREGCKWYSLQSAYNALVPLVGVSMTKIDNAGDLTGKKLCEDDPCGLKDVGFNCSYSIEEKECISEQVAIPLP